MPVIVDCQTCGRKLRVPDDLMDQSVKCPTCGHVFHSSGARPNSESAPEPVHSEPVPTHIPGRPSTGVPRVPTLDPAEQRSASGGGFGFVEVSRGAADPPAPGRKPPDPLPTHGDRRDSDHGLPPRMSECPFCGELIARTARRCQFCGRWVDDEWRPWDSRQPRDRRDVEPHRGGLILALGIISLVVGITVFLIPIAWIPGVVAWVMGQNDLGKINRGLMESTGYGTTQAGWICGIIATCLWGLGTLACCGWWMLVRV